jgi:hypothetical protein
MLEFAIANLLHADPAFEIPSSLGKWQFRRFPKYKDVLSAIDKGMCANTYFASLPSISPTSSDAQFLTACDEIVDICLVLSFLTARCVTPSSSTSNSDIGFMSLGDSFVVARSIAGFPSFSPCSFVTIFAGWLGTAYPAYRSRTLRLQLCHWLSGLTCFSLEDLYLSAGVQMDIVKQRERASTGNSSLTYFQGMLSASTRYSLSPLGSDYKNMRNDIVHEGILSGNNFPGKSKSECAEVVAETLNWLDAYVLAVIGVPSPPGGARWRGQDLERGLPAISVKFNSSEL